MKTEDQELWEKSKKYNKFFWTDTYLLLAEQEFDNIFADIFEE